MADAPASPSSPSIVQLPLVSALYSLSSSSLALSVPVSPAPSFQLANVRCPMPGSPGPMRLCVLISPSPRNGATLDLDRRGYAREFVPGTGQSICTPRTKVPYSSLGSPGPLSARSRPPATRQAIRVSRNRPLDATPLHLLLSADSAAPRKPILSPKPATSSNGVLPTVGGTAWLLACLSCLVLSHPIPSHLPGLAD